MSQEYMVITLCSIAAFALGMAAGMLCGFNAGAHLRGYFDGLNDAHTVRGPHNDDRFAAKTERRDD